AIIATGGQEYRGNEYLLGQDGRVITMGDLEEKIEKKPEEIAKVNEVAMVLCVGPWQEKSFYCSRTCCTVSIKNAIKIKELNPSANVYVLHKDLRSYGFKERLYTEARRKGVIFIRYTDDRPPRVESVNGQLQVTVWEPSLAEELKLTPDLLALATATVSAQNAKDLGLAFKVPITQEGFFLEAHVKLRPVDFASEGIFLCGTAHYPKFIDEAVAQAMAAAARASTILAKDYLEAGGAVAVVDPKKCVACLTCVRLCPYRVPRINADGVAEISMASCQGCGVCAGECPAKAIELLHYRDAQIISKSEALMKLEPVTVMS
ncbi:MAG: 4Fe-4S binding protein, partial [Dehalococcoidia bacterium]|nr:4Fe-4S binding protein [Dehalococcoidia bacterium]